MSTLPIKSRWIIILIAGIAVAACLASIRAPAQSAGQSEADFEQASAEFRAGNYASAAAKFAAVEAAFPGVTDALLFQARCFVHLENFAGAESALRAYLGSHRDSADARYLLGFVLHRENRPDESLSVYTEAAALVLPRSDDLKIVGLDYVLLNDYPDAIKWLEKAVELDPQNKDAWYYLGRAYYTKGRLSESKAAFLHVLEIDARDARAENNLGLILETEGQPSAAADAYRQAIAWQQGSFHPSEQPYVNLGNLLMEQGESKEALEALQRSAELAPTNAYCHLKLGMYYRKTGQLDGAKRELEKATALEPDNAVAHYQLGRVYKETNSMARAKAEFDRAAELQARSAGSSAERH
jgi:tetratricopeptide (TPR) repeat protein